MASMILAGILAIVGIFALLNTQAVDYDTYSNIMHIRVSGPMNTIHTPTFERISLDYLTPDNDHDNSPYAMIYFRETGDFIIQQCDTATVPSITMNSDWDKYMNLEVSDNTLHMTISIPKYNKDKKNRHSRPLIAPDSITVTIPAGMLREAVCTTPNTVVLRNLCADSLSAEVRCNVTMADCRIKDVDIYHPHDNRHSLTLYSTVIDRLKLSSENNKMDIAGAADSRIGTLVCPAHDNTVLDTHRTRINSFDWSGSDSTALTLYTCGDLSLSITD